MGIQVGINGFGRIGRNLLRAAINDKNIQIVAVNDLTDPKTLSHLLRYDSIHGRFDGTVESDEDSIIVNGQKIKVLSTRNPADLPWGDLGVEIAVESTGIFTKREDAGKHIEAGAKKVIISAPASGEDITVVLGVNDHKYNHDEHHIISNASCTTNCLAPVAKVLHEKFEIRHGLMTTTHAYTNDQKILDLPHSDLRRARAAAVSMIPTSTGAAKAVGLVLPELNGKLDGMAIRVPTQDVSVVDLVAELGQEVTAEEVNNTLKEASEGKMKGILDYTDEPLVSIDFLGSSASSTIDGLSTKVLDNKMVKIISWYDNEWGFSCRMVDLIKKIGANS
jgi:glyceraldehyde 3-phosphate dehydrogenase